jgi:hypothetical protein
MKKLKIKHLAALISHAWVVERNIGSYISTDLFRKNIETMDDATLMAVMDDLNALLATVRSIGESDIAINISHATKYTQSSPPALQLPDDFGRLPIIDGDTLRTNTADGTDNEQHSK